MRTYLGFLIFDLESESSVHFVRDAISLRGNAAPNF